MIETHGLRQTSAHYSRMGPQECERIHAGCLEVLERVGVEVHDERARQILVKGGGKADGIRIRLPGTWCAGRSSAPQRMTLCDRNGKVAMRAWAQLLLRRRSDCLNILDPRGQRRRAEWEINRGAICRRAAEIDFPCPLCPRRCPAHLRPLPDGVMLNHSASPSSSSRRTSRAVWQRSRCVRLSRAARRHSSAAPSPPATSTSPPA